MIEFHKDKLPPNEDGGWVAAQDPPLVKAMLLKIYDEIIDMCDKRWEMVRQSNSYTPDEKLQVEVILIAERKALRIAKQLVEEHYADPKEVQQGDTSGAAG